MPHASCFMLAPMDSKCLWNLFFEAKKQQGSLHASHSENKTYIWILSLGKIIAVIYSIGTKYICLLLSHVALEKKTKRA